MNALPNPRFKDFVTVLKSQGVRLTKTFDGPNVIPYGDAKHFTIETSPVDNIRDLHGVLRFLAPKSTRCVIRGQFKGDAAAQEIAPPTRPGQYQRINALFDEVPHHWVMFDIDRYSPILYDPALEPAEAIQEFIEDKLPPEFHQASYCWQLSSSAGRTPGVLKCHIWFWFSTAFTGPQLKAWIRANDMPIDVAPLRTVQVGYTADPIFTNGAVDPIPRGKRSGFHTGRTDEVALEIPEEVLSAAYEAPDTGDAFDLSDPTKKPGLIGAFCTAYPISRVINELLPEEFVYAEGSERRVTWLNSGGGAPEGCFVTDDDWHFGNTHNSDPADGRLLNAWDMVRLYKFGDKDAHIPQVDRWEYQINELPSHVAMKAWAAELPEVKATAAVATQTARDGYLASIRGASTERVLRAEVLPFIARDKTLSKADLAILIAAIQASMRAFTSVPITAAIAKGLLREAGREGAIPTEAPFWVRPFVYVTNGDIFFNLDTKEAMSKQGFDVSFNRFMVPFMADDGSIPAASKHAPDVWHIDTVSNIAYNPTLGRTFTQGDLLFANTYSTGSVPDVPPVLTDDEDAAVALVEAHTCRLLPDDRERTLFLDWLAHNVQFPGRKIRWAVFLHGAPGCGKSFFQMLLAATMGPENVHPLNASTLIKSDFTEWSNKAAVVVIEEVKVPAHSAREAENKLKAPVSNPYIEVHPKGKACYVVPNVTNYLILSNFRDGLPIDKSDRRYMALKAAIGEAEAKALSDAGYFERLFDAVERHGGALRKWLLDRKLSDEFKPDGRAPWTTEKDRVIESSKSETQTVAEDLIAEGCPGVTNQVVSTAHLMEAVKARTGEKAWTRQVPRILEDAGFEAYGRVKWAGEARRLYVRRELVTCLPSDQKEANELLRKLLDVSTVANDFLD